MGGLRTPWRSSLVPAGGIHGDASAFVAVATFGDRRTAIFCSLCRFVSPQRFGAARWLLRLLSRGVHAGWTCVPTPARPRHIGAKKNDVADGAIRRCRFSLSRQVPSVSTTLVVTTTDASWGANDKIAFNDLPENHRSQRAGFSMLCGPRFDVGVTTHFNLLLRAEAHSKRLLVWFACGDPCAPSEGWMLHEALKDMKCQLRRADCEKSTACFFVTCG